jgi:hypothetical protein
MLFGYWWHYYLSLSLSYFCFPNIDRLSFFFFFILIY